MNKLILNISLFSLLCASLNTNAQSIFKCKVIKISDGDTFHAMVKMPSPNDSYDNWIERKVVVRVHLADTFETDDEDKMKRTLAVEGKQFALVHLLNKEVTIRYWYKDQFRRWTCDVFVKRRNYAKMLKRAGLTTGLHEKIKHKRMKRK